MNNNRGYSDQRKNSEDGISIPNIRRQPAAGAVRGTDAVRGSRAGKMAGMRGESNTSGSRVARASRNAGGAGSPRMPENGRTNAGGRAASGAGRPSSEGRGASGSGRTYAREHGSSRGGRTYAGGRAASGGRRPSGSTRAGRGTSGTAMRARAVGRRRRKQRQQMTIMAVSMAALVIAAVIAVMGIRTHLKNKKIDAFREEGITAMKGRDYEAAIKQFDQALELAGSKIGKKEIDTLQRRAEAEYSLGDYAAALDSWNILMENDPQNEDYKTNAVLCMLETGQYEEALKIGVLQSRVYNKMALDKIKISDYEGALASIEYGMAVDDGSVAADLMYNQAAAYEGRGDYEQALQIFQDYVDRYGSDENVEKEISFLKTRVDGGSADANEETQEPEPETESGAEETGGEDTTAAAEGESPGEG